MFKQIPQNIDHHLNDIRRRISTKKPNLQNLILMNQAKRYYCLLSIIFIILLFYALQNKIKYFLRQHFYLIFKFHSQNNIFIQTYKSLIDGAKDFSFVFQCFDQEINRTKFLNVMQFNEHTKYILNQLQDFHNNNIKILSYYYDYFLEIFDIYFLMNNDKNKEYFIIESEEYSCENKQNDDKGLIKTVTQLFQKLHFLDQSLNFVSLQDNLYICKNKDQKKKIRINLLNDVFITAKKMNLKEKRDYFSNSLIRSSKIREYCHEFHHQVFEQFEAVFCREQSFQYFRIDEINKQFLNLSVYNKSLNSLTKISYQVMQCKQIGETLKKLLDELNERCFLATFGISEYELIEKKNKYILEIKAYHKIDYWQSGKNMMEQDAEIIFNHLHTMISCFGILSKYNFHLFLNLQDASFGDCFKSIHMSFPFLQEENRLNKNIEFIRQMLQLNEIRQTKFVKPYLEEQIDILHDALKKQNAQQQLHSDQKINIFAKILFSLEKLKHIVILKKRGYDVIYDVNNQMDTYLDLKDINDKDISSLKCINYIKIDLYQRQTLQLKLILSSLTKSNFLKGLSLYNILEDHCFQKQIKIIDQFQSLKSLELSYDKVSVKFLSLQQNAPLLNLETLKISFCPKYDYESYMCTDDIIINQILSYVDLQKSLKKILCLKSLNYILESALLPHTNDFNLVSLFEKAKSQNRLIFSSDLDIFSAYREDKGNSKKIMNQNNSSHCFKEEQSSQNQQFNNQTSKNNLQNSRFDISLFSDPKQNIFAITQESGIREDKENSKIIQNQNNSSQCQKEEQSHQNQQFNNHSSIKNQQNSKLDISLFSNPKQNIFAITQETGIREGKGNSKIIQNQPQGQKEEQSSQNQQFSNHSSINTQQNSKLDISLFSNPKQNIFTNPYETEKDTFQIKRQKNFSTNDQIDNQINSGINYPQSSQIPNLNLNEFQKKQIKYKEPIISFFYKQQEGFIFNDKQQEYINLLATLEQIQHEYTNISIHTQIVNQKEDPLIIEFENIKNKEFGKLKIQLKMIDNLLEILHLECRSQQKLTCHYYGQPNFVLNIRLIKNWLKFENLTSFTKKFIESDSIPQCSHCDYNSLQQQIYLDQTALQALKIGVMVCEASIEMKTFQIKFSQQQQVKLRELTLVFKQQPTPLHSSTIFKSEYSFNLSTINTIINQLSKLQNLNRLTIIVKHKNPYEQLQQKNPLFQRLKKLKRLIYFQID